MKTLSKLLVMTAFTAFLASCSSAPKEVPYFVEAETIPESMLAQINPYVEPFFIPGDLLDIQVSATNMKSVMAFNKGVYVDEKGEVANMQLNRSSGNSTSNSYVYYYLVDAAGYIEFPIIGKIKVGGLKKAQVVEELTRQLMPKYVTEKPTIDVRLVNFRVVALGAFNSPGIIQSENEHLNIIEAVAKAGDLNIQGRRDNIMLIRTHSDGHRTITRLNINDKSILYSPYYNLCQNDILYVEPNKYMAEGSWNLTKSYTVGMTLFSGVTAVVAMVFSILNYVKKDN